MVSAPIPQVVQHDDHATGAVEVEKRTDAEREEMRDLFLVGETNLQAEAGTDAMLNHQPEIHVDAVQAEAPTDSFVQDAAPTQEHATVVAPPPTLTKQTATRPNPASASPTTFRVRVQANEHVSRDREMSVVASSLAEFNSAVTTELVTTGLEAEFCIRVFDDDFAAFSAFDVAFCDIPRHVLVKLVRL